MTIEIIQFPCLEDNYGYLIHDSEENLTVTVDSPDPVVIQQILQDKGWSLTHILNTHHHWDHAGGNLELKSLSGCTIIGSAKDAHRIPGIDIQVGEGDQFMFGNQPVLVQETPGHTLGHIVYRFPVENVSFVGDTLFSLGCGRLFEGTPNQMWNSLQKIKHWPDETLIYCAHEYTQENARFALTIDPENQDLQLRCKEVDQLRSQGRATVPTTLGLEKKTNPFLRPHSLAIRKMLDMMDASDEEVFAQIRRLKDNF